MKKLFHWRHFAFLQLIVLAAAENSTVEYHAVLSDNIWNSYPASDNSAPYAGSAKWTQQQIDDDLSLTEMSDRMRTLDYSGTSRNIAAFFDKIPNSAGEEEDYVDNNSQFQEFKEPFTSGITAGPCSLSLGDAMLMNFLCSNEWRPMEEEVSGNALTWESNPTRELAGEDALSEEWKSSERDQSDKDDGIKLWNLDETINGPETETVPENDQFSSAFLIFPSPENVASTVASETERDYSGINEDKEATSDDESITAMNLPKNIQKNRGEEKRQKNLMKSRKKGSKQKSMLRKPKAKAKRKGKIKIKSSDALPVFVCSTPKCGKVFKDELNYRQHIELVHHDNRPYGCNWTSCFARFNKRTDLQRHYCRHTGKKEFKCHICGMETARGDYLKKHLTAIHGEKDQYKCSASGCQKTFESVAELRDHIELVHATSAAISDPCICSLCNKKYTTKATMKRHMRTHMQERGYSCAACDKSFNRPDMLKRHIANVHSARRK